MYTSSSTLSCMCTIDVDNLVSVHCLRVSLYAIEVFDFHAVHLRNLRVLLQPIAFPAINISV
jgi:hypothetical protein